MSRAVLRFVLEEFAAVSKVDVDRHEMSGFTIARTVDDDPSPGAAWLRARGENWHDGGDRLARASDEYIAAQRGADARYKASPAGRAAREREFANRRKKARARRKRRAYVAKNLARVRTKARVQKRLKLGWDARRAATAEARPWRRPDSVYMRCKALGLPHNTVLRRLGRGWSLEKALSTPVRKCASPRRSA